MPVSVLRFFKDKHEGMEKKMQNEQTEPAGGTRRRTKVRREVKVAYSLQAKKEIRKITDFYKVI